MHSSSYLYFMPVLMLWSLEDGTLWTDSCPRLRATMATALNLLRVPALGLLAFCRFRRSSVLRLMERWSVHTNDTCILTRATQCDHKTKFLSLSPHTLPQNQAEKKAQEEVSSILIRMRIRETAGALISRGFSHYT